MDCHSIGWRRHALERMFERNITRAQVKQVLKSGMIIETYRDDQPFPSKLIYALVDEVPLHVVVAQDTMTAECYVVTAYIPDTAHFESDLITRIKI